jgi:hypothetical protein
MQRSETGVTVNLDRDCWGTTVTGITRTVDVDLMGMECDCAMSVVVHWQWQGQDEERVHVVACP